MPGQPNQSPTGGPGSQDGESRAVNREEKTGATTNPGQKGANRPGSQGVWSSLLTRPKKRPRQKRDPAGPKGLLFTPETQPRGAKNEKPPQKPPQRGKRAPSQPKIGEPAGPGPRPGNRARPKTEKPARPFKKPQRGPGKKRPPTNPMGENRKAPPPQVPSEETPVPGGLKPKTDPGAGFNRKEKIPPAPPCAHGGKGPPKGHPVKKEKKKVPPTNKKGQKNEPGETKPCFPAAGKRKTLPPSPWPKNPNFGHPQKWVPGFPNQLGDLDTATSVWARPCAGGLQRKVHCVGFPQDGRQGRGRRGVGGLGGPLSSKQRLHQHVRATAGGVDSGPFVRYPCPRRTSKELVCPGRG
ncbi:unnamed protein product [Arctia plantaginis]|uniref:Uncharacterized protein n=1 Tax=Arctia plantaginis TaxID=874455 RepID=A0A8S0YLF6_ARCPL|nr:unnamed protein product [Arctia plantaginis]